MPSSLAPSGPKPSPPAPVGPAELVPTRLDREWPGPSGAASRAAVAGVAATAVLAAVVLVLSRPGVGWLLVAAALAGTGIATSRASRPIAGGHGVEGIVTGAERRGGLGHGGGTGRKDGAAQGEGNGREGGASDLIQRIERVGWALAAVLLVGVGTLRADGMLFTWCVLAALACAAIALAGAATLRSLVLAASLLAIAPLRALGWWGRGVAGVRRVRGGVRIGRTVLITLALLVLFGVLFTTADPAFAHFAADVMPRLDGPELGRGILALLVAGALALGVAFLAARRPALDAHAGGPAKTVRRAEWAVPVAVLDALFLAFVLVQLAVLFGGRRRVLATEGLTYAQYARSGFWQLLVVAALTLAVIGVASRVASRRTVADRALLRGLLGALTVLTLVIVASAVQRITVYDGAYGYTRLRLAVGVIEGWLGLVFLLVLVAGIGRGRQRWLPRVAAGTAVLALLGTAIVGPDRLIAQRNVDRFQATGQIDLVYLSKLSADALPALRRLPDNLRLCAAGPIENRLARIHDDWRSWNLARSRAELDLVGRQANECESYTS